MSDDLALEIESVLDAVLTIGKSNEGEGDYAIIGIEHAAQALSYRFIVLARQHDALLEAARAFLKSTQHPVGAGDGDTFTGSSECCRFRSRSRT